LGQELTILAENVVLEKGKQVEVTIAETSEPDNAFILRNGEASELEYTVERDNKLIAVGESILVVNPETASHGSVKLSFVAPANIQFAGTYSGTITFSVSVEEAEAQ